MARRKGNRARADDSDDENDTTSTISSLGTSSMYSGDTEDEFADKEASQLEVLVEALYEKRGSSREAGLRGLIAAFTSAMMADVIQDKYETLVNRFVASIKKSGASSGEVGLACRALGLLAVTVAGDDDLGLRPLVKECLGPLVKLAKGTSDSASRLAALECLAVVSYIGMHSGDVDVESGTPCGPAPVLDGGILNLFWQICSSSGKGGGAAARAVAISCWSLLFTTLPSYRVKQHVQVALPALCAVLIDAGDPGLRKAAGEAVGLLFQVAEFPQEDDLDGSSGQQEEEDRNRNSQQHQQQVSVLVANMKALMVKESGAEGNKSRQTKVERATKINTSSFRAFVGSIEGGCQCRESVVKLQHGDALRVCGWDETVQLNFLRKYLAEGFQKHMQENGFLHHVFKFVPRDGPAKRGSKREKKLCNASYDKARTVAMNQRRSIKDQYLAAV